MATEQNVGQTLPLSIRFLDAAGQEPQPGEVAPVPDSPPEWANSSPLIEGLSAAADGMTAAATGLAAGADTIRVTLRVGGIVYAATLDVTVNARVPSFTLASIEIIAGTPA